MCFLETEQALLYWKQVNSQGIISTFLHADGKHKDLLKVPAGISTDYASVKEGNAYIEMQGNEVFKMAVNTLGRIVDETLAANNLDKHDIDWLITPSGQYQDHHGDGKKT